MDDRRSEFSFHGSRLIGTEERVVEVRYTFQIESRELYTHAWELGRRREDERQRIINPFTTNKESRERRGVNLLLLYILSVVCNRRWGKSRWISDSIARRERIIAIANRNADYRRDRLQRGRFAKHRGKKSSCRKPDILWIDTSNFRLREKCREFGGIGVR